MQKQPDLNPSFTILDQGDSEDVINLNQEPGRFYWKRKKISQ